MSRSIHHGYEGDSKAIRRWIDIFRSEDRAAIRDYLRAVRDAANSGNDPEEVYQPSDHDCRSAAKWNAF